MYALEKGFLCDPYMTLTLDLQTSLIFHLETWFKVTAYPFTQRQSLGEV